jgi:hypothetical protein
MDNSEMKKNIPNPDIVQDISSLKREFYRKETAWHRDWKLAFPPSFREIAFFIANCSLTWPVQPKSMYI